MINFKPLIIFFCLFAFTQVKAQNDSTRLLRHEIGFNTVSLVKQLISNNPSSTLAQLPYDIFYNLYYKDQIGLRLGLGLANQKTETNIEGQLVPRTSNNKNLYFRAGVSYNFVQYKRLSLNVFGDFITENLSQESTSTQTVQTFGNPVQTIVSSSLDQTKGNGGQVGVGVKFNLYKHLSLYAEILIMYMVEKNTTSDAIASPGFPTQENSGSSKNTVSRITLPTTVYLVLRF